MYFVCELHIFYSLASSVANVHTNKMGKQELTIKTCRIPMTLRGGNVGKARVYMQGQQWERCNMD